MLEKQPLSNLSVKPCFLMLRDKQERHVRNCTGDPISTYGGVLLQIKLFYYSSLKDAAQKIRGRSNSFSRGSHQRDFTYTTITTTSTNLRKKPRPPSPLQPSHCKTYREVQPRKSWASVVRTAGGNSYFTPIFPCTR